MEQQKETSIAENKSSRTLDDYIGVNSTFTDYTRFDDISVDARNREKRAFMDNVEYVPHYSYPKLRFLTDESSITTKKTETYNAVLELEVARNAAQLVGDDTRAAELMLYRSFHDIRLKKVMLVEAAHRLHYSGDSQNQEVARSDFMRMNEEVYGEMDQDLFDSALGDMRKKFDAFVPKGKVAEDVRSSLFALFAESGEFAEHSSEVLSSPEMQTLHSIVLDRYSTILSVVPDTDKSVTYDAEQCAAIMNSALLAGGLADKGWRCEVNPERTNPSTNGAKKIIYLPSNTRRTADELRRLIVHEQEVHARRAYNGAETGEKLVEKGTAEYTDVEEGLGVLLECAVAGSLDNPSFKRARDRYIVAGLALGMDNTHPRDAREVYEIVWRMMAIEASTDGQISDELISQAKDATYKHVENAYRGTGFWMKGVIYTKLKVYYEGLMKNIRYVKDNMSQLSVAIDAAMVGKIDHTNVEEVQLVHAILEKRANT